VAEQAAVRPPYRDQRLKAKSGNPNAVLGGPSPNPKGKTRGLAKFSAWKLGQLLDIWGPDVPKFAKMMMRKALDENEPNQLGWAKEVAVRLFPSSKAIEVTGLSAKTMELKVIVSGVEEFASERVISGESVDVTEKEKS
jgi:hypothetical protein